MPAPLRNISNRAPGVVPNGITPGPGGGGHVTGPGGFNAYGDPHTMGQLPPTTGAPGGLAPGVSGINGMHGDPAGGMSGVPPWVAPRGGMTASSSGFVANPNAHNPNAGFGPDPTDDMSGAGSMDGAGAIQPSMNGGAVMEGADFNPYPKVPSPMAPGMGGAKPLSMGPASGLGGAAAGRMQLADLIRRGGQNY